MYKYALFTAATLIFILALAPSETRAQEQHDAPKVEVGAQFSSLSITPPNSFGTENATGFGGRVTYNINDHFAVEAEGNFYPTGLSQTYVTGGKAEQMQFGPKIGKRFRHFGLFAKARPGFVTFSRVLHQTGTETFTFGSQTFVFPTFDDRRRTYFSTDLGGVLELYPSSRILTRFDFGDTLIRYGQRDARGLITGTLPPGIPSSTRHNFQFTAGLGLRF
ncbi:MAG: outer membrane beta-barrel protein [Pyrinomonadaceae bacterium]